MFLQSIGLLPDNIIILSTSREKSEQRITEKLKITDPNSQELAKMTKDAIDQYDLNIKSVRNIFKGFFSEIDHQEKSKELILEELAVRKIVL